MERIQNVYEITQRLCGMITPYGDSEIDKVRMDNLKDTISVAERLIDDILEVLEFSVRKENSIAMMGKEAKDFIERLRERIG